MNNHFPILCSSDGSIECKTKAIGQERGIIPHYRKVGTRSTKVRPDTSIWKYRSKLESEVNKTLLNMKFN